MALTNQNKKQKNNTMKKLLVVLLVALSINGFAQQKEIEWHTDVNKAIKISTETGKPLFMFFTGSDWCGWCIKLQKAVFHKPEFKKWASNTVILVELDFPKRTSISPELLKQNRKLATEFGVRGYPTVWFADANLKNGKMEMNKLGFLGAQPLDAKSWIARANKILNTK